MRRWTNRSLVMGLGLLGLVSGMLVWGRNESRAQGKVKPPANLGKQAEAPVPAVANTPPSDYSKRVVAYIYNTIPITREDLGEYLIARHGADRLNNLVNKKIIEHECRQRGIEITAAEVEASLEEDLRGLNVNRKEFVEQVLKKYNKTLYEWREDVIKPRLMMTQLCRARVQVTAEDVQKAYEAYYGEKVEARIILWPLGEEKLAARVYDKIRGSSEGFDEEARKQANPSLAASGGRIRPIGRHTTGNPELEKLAFSLKPGDVSEVFGTPEGPVVLKVLKRIPADTSKKLEDVRAHLEKEVFDKKVQQEIGVVFKELQERAKPKTFLKSYTSDEELLSDIRSEIGGAAAKGDAAVPLPEVKR